MVPGYDRGVLRYCRGHIRCPMGPGEAAKLQDKLQRNTKNWQHTVHRATSQGKVEFLTFPISLTWSQGTAEVSQGTGGHTIQVSQGPGEAAKIQTAVAEQDKLAPYIEQFQREKINFLPSQSVQQGPRVQTRCSKVPQGPYQVSQGPGEAAKIQDKLQQKRKNWHHTESNFTWIIEFLTFPISPTWSQGTAEVSQGPGEAAKHQRAVAEQEKLAPYIEQFQREKNRFLTFPISPTWSQGAAEVSQGTAGVMPGVPGYQSSRQLCPVQLLSSFFLVSI